MNPSTKSELLELSASQAAPSLRSGRRSHVDYTSALLSRFEEIKFDATLTPDFTPEKLKAQLSLPIEGKLRGALAGVPFLVTPNIDVSGFKTHAGAKTLALASPDTDAPVVAALKAAGGIVMGQANMHELGQGVTCVNATYGAAKNPFSSFGIPGGSAGGAAAAVASRLAPFAICIDTVGDARVPASLCGVVGYRPTHGRFSREGVLSTSHTLDSASIIARTVHDVQLVDAVLCSAQKIADAAAIAAPEASSSSSESKEGGKEEISAADEEREKAALKMQSMSRGFVARKRVEKVAKGEIDTKAAIAKPPSAEEIERERVKAAARIQAVARGKAERGFIGRKHIEKESAEARLAALTHSDDAAVSAEDAKSARAAADAALAAEAAKAKGHDLFEAAIHGDSATGSDADWSGKAAFVKDLQGVRIGVPRPRYYEGLDASTAAVVEEALRKLTRSGAILVECDFALGSTADNNRHPIDLAVDVIGPILAYEAPRELASYLYTHVAPPEEKKPLEEGEEPPELSEEEAAALAKLPPPGPRPLDSVVSVTSIFEGYLGSAAEKAALTSQLSRKTACTATTYRSALVYRRPALKRMFSTLMKQHSLACVVYPCTPLPSAQLRGVGSTQVEINGEVVDANSLYTRNTSAAAAAGLPALSIPVGLTKPFPGAPKGSPGAERLPVALEFVADSNDDERLLSVGRAVQRVMVTISDPLVIRKWNSGITYPHLQS